MKIDAHTRLLAGSVDMDRLKSWTATVIAMPDEKFETLLRGIRSAGKWFDEFATWKGRMTKAPLLSSANDFESSGIYFLSVLRSFMVSPAQPRTVYRAAYTREAHKKGERFLYKHIRPVSSWSLIQKLPRNLLEVRDETRIEKVHDIFLEAHPSANQIVWSPDCMVALRSLLRYCDKGKDRRHYELFRYLEGLDESIRDRVREKEVILYIPQGIEVKVLNVKD